MEPSMDSNDGTPQGLWFLRLFNPQRRPLPLRSSPMNQQGGRPFLSWLNGSSQDSYLPRLDSGVAGSQAPHQARVRETSPLVEARSATSLTGTGVSQQPKTRSAKPPLRPLTHKIAQADRQWCINQCRELTLMLAPALRIGTFEQCMAHCEGRSLWPQFLPYVPYGG
jgi:hypothetical protein